MNHKNTNELRMLIALLLLLPGTAFSQGNDFRPVSNLSVFKTTFQKEAAKVQSIQSDFTQRKSLAVLEEALNSSGKFYFKRENKVRIEYEKPFKYLMIVNGDQILIKDGSKESKVNLGSSKLFKQVNGIIMDAVRGTILDNKDFEAQVMENSKSYLLKMQPVSKTLKDLFSAILIYVDRSDFSVNEIQMLEVSSDFTTMIFSNKQLNSNISDEKFSIH